MRHMEVRRRILDPTTILHRILDHNNMKAFHGPDTELSAWNDHTRTVSFYINASGSPISLGSYVKANVHQKYMQNCIQNTVKLLNLATITSTWRVETIKNAPWIVTRANINVHLPPPLSWVAERFVETRAKEQINDYITLLEEAPLVSLPQPISRY